MSLSTQTTPLSCSTKAGGSEAKPVNPAAGESWNRAEVLKDSSADNAEIDLGDGNGFQLWLGSETKWTGDFKASSNPIKVRPAVEGHNITGIRASARYIPGRG